MYVDVKPTNQDTISRHLKIHSEFEEDLSEEQVKCALQQRESQVTHLSKSAPVSQETAIESESQKAHVRSETAVRHDSLELVPCSNMRTEAHTLTDTPLYQAAGHTRQQTQPPNRAQVQSQPTVHARHPLQTQTPQRPHKHPYQQSHSQMLPPIYTHAHSRPPATGYLTFDWFSCERRGVELHYTWVESDVLPTACSKAPQANGCAKGSKQRNNGSRESKHKRNGRANNHSRDNTRASKAEPVVTGGRQFVARLDTELPESAAFAVGMSIAAWLIMGYDADVLVVKCGQLTTAQTDFWVNLYRGALSEFYYINDLVVPKYTIISKGPVIAPHEFTLEDDTTSRKRVLVPLGGGKDSLVALERMRASGYTCTLLYVGGEPGEYEASWRLSALVAATGCECLLVELDLGDCWTAESEHDKADVQPITPPYSALVAFVAAGVAATNGFDYIAVGNECSANFGNDLIVPGEGGDVVVNHQYDKSFESESLTSSYIAQYIYADVHYFSALMDVWELQIAEAFSRLPQYHALFISCNEPLNTSRWCAQCPKCVFVFVLLSAYLDPPKPWAVFGDNLFLCEGLWPEFEALMGLGGHKPFECVGTPDETLAALKMARARYKHMFPNMDLPQFFVLHQRLLDKTPDSVTHPAEHPADSRQHAIPEDVLPLTRVGIQQ